MLNFPRTARRRIYTLWPDDLVMEKDAGKIRFALLCPICGLKNWLVEEELHGTAVLACQRLECPFVIRFDLTELFDRVCWQTVGLCDLWMPREKSRKGKPLGHRRPNRK